MDKAMTWRRLEAIMVETLIEFGYSLDQNSRTGDKFIVATPKGQSDIAGNEFNITAFAQEIHDRMKVKP